MPILENHRIYFIGPLFMNHNYILYVSEEKCRIPDGTKEVIFDDDFNYPLRNIHIPSTVTHITFGEGFNHDFREGQLPYGLFYLKLGKYFNSRLFYLPYSLKVLELGDNFNQPMSNIQFPKKLESLTFGKYFNQPLIYNLYKLTYLKFNGDYKYRFAHRCYDNTCWFHFPNLKTLIYSDQYTGKIWFEDEGKTYFSMNERLETLVLPKSYNQPLLPEGRVSFGDVPRELYHQSCFLPKTLKNLKISKEFYEKNKEALSVIPNITFY